MSSHAHLDADLREILTGWAAPSLKQDALRQEYLEHLAAHTDATAKAGPPAHATASCLVIDASRERVLLTLHKKVGRWLQLGGHLEAGDASVAAGALREALEESGLGPEQLTLQPGPAQLDRHALGSGFTRCTEHLDVQWIAVAAPGAEPRRSEESDDLAWWPLADLPADIDPALASLVALATTGSRS